MNRPSPIETLKQHPSKAGLMMRDTSHFFRSVTDARRPQDRKFVYLFSFLLHRYTYEFSPIDNVNQ